MGTATVAGQRLGAGDTSGAKHAFSQGFWFSTISILIITALVWIFAPQVANILGATPDLKEGVVTFIRIFMLFYPFCILGQMMSAVLRVDEKPGLASAAAFISAVIAIIWLYVSINVANLGIKGPAVYYGISIGLWFLVIFYFIFDKNTIFKIDISDIKLNFATNKEIMVIGLPTFLVSVASMIYTIIINNYLGVLGGELELAAFAILNGYLVYIVNMIALCATYGLQPIASYNYGAKKFDRMKQLIKFSSIITVAVLAVLSIIFIVLAEPICRVFVGDDPDLISMAAVNALPILMLGALGQLSQLMSAYFQAVGKVIVSTVLGVARYLFFTVPAIIIMSKILGITGVWWAQPVADAITFIFVLFFIVAEFKRLRKLETGELKVEKSL